MPLGRSSNSWYYNYHLLWGARGAEKANLEKSASKRDQKFSCSIDISILALNLLRFFVSYVLFWGGLINSTERGG